jgi:hypothetical protein
MAGDGLARFLLPAKEDFNMGAADIDGEDFHGEGMARLVVC